MLPICEYGKEDAQRSHGSLTLHTRIEEAPRGNPSVETGSSASMSSSSAIPVSLPVRIPPPPATAPRLPETVMQGEVQIPPVPAMAGQGGQDN